MCGEKELWSQLCKRTVMIALPFLCFFNTVVLHFVASTVSLQIEPKVGSIAGGTWITLTFDGLSPEQSSLIYSTNGSLPEVYLMHPELPKIACDVHPVYSDLSVIKCKTRASQQEGLYWLEVIANGRVLNYLCDNSCMFKFSADQTPVIYQVNPPFGVPGNMIQVTGWIITARYETYDFNVEYINGPVILEAEEDGWLTLCSFVNKKTKEIYPIQVDRGHGTLQCCVEGNYIGSQNVSFSVFNKGKSLVNKDAWLISAKQELFLYQTHPDILSVIPGFGSLRGGTKIIIKGNFFLHPAKVTVAGVPCEIRHISPNKIQCTTGSVDSSRRFSTPQPGNRGLLFEVWEGAASTNLTDTTPGYRWQFVPNASSPLDFMSAAPQLFSARLHGFFVAPETNNYTFWIQGDASACLYFSHSEDPKRKERIASIPDGISGWSDYWDSNWNDRWQQKSQKFELIGGMKYYLEALHHGRSPTTGLSVGVQIHNTWLNPDVVNTYHREKIKIEVQACRRPEIQTMTFSGTGWVSLSWDNKSTSLIPTNATAAEIQSAIEEILSIKCRTEPSSASVLLRMGFETGLDDSGVDGHLTSWTEPFCGRFSILSPKHLIKRSKSTISRYVLNTYPYVCFAYKGYLKDALNISLSYTNVFQKSVKKNLTCFWNFNESSPESWTFGCTDLWRDCAISSKLLRDLPINSSVLVEQIDLFPQVTNSETLGWFYVDELIVSDRNITVSQIDYKPARPGGNIIETFTVTGLSPTYNLTFLIANCGSSLPLITLSRGLPSEEHALDGNLAEFVEYGNGSVNLTVQRSQVASPPVGGTVRIQLSNAVISGVPVNISSHYLKELLQSNSDSFTAQYINASDFTVIKDLSTCNHNIYTLTWTSMVGDLPNMISVFAENLTGLNPSVETRVVYDGGVFIGPIFGDMLATASEISQVTVHVNDIPASCSGSCSFQYLQEVTPLVTDIHYSSGGLWITLRGTSLIGVDLVLIGSQPCLLNMYSCNSTSIECKAPAWAGGNHVVNVTVGDGSHTTILTEAFKYDVSLNPVIVSLSRNISNTAGDQRLQIGMSLFDSYTNLDVEVKIQDTLAMIEEQTSHGIEVILPPLPEGLYNLSVAINGIQIHSNRLEPLILYVTEIHDVEPCCGSFLGGTLLTISGIGFSKNASLVSIFLNASSCDIISSTEEKILCWTPPVIQLSNITSQSISVPVQASIGNSSDVLRITVESSRNNFVFSYQADFTPVVCSITWEMMNGSLWFNLEGNNLNDSVVFLEDFECKIQQINERETEDLYKCAFPLKSLEAGLYPIRVFQRKMGYANITAPLKSFTLVPQIFSVNPSHGSSCSELWLTILGLALKSSRNLVEVSVMDNYTCVVQTSDDNIIECILQVDPFLDGLNNISQILNITVTINGINGVCRKDCTFKILEEWIPKVDQVTHEVNGTLTTIWIRGQRLTSAMQELSILVDSSLVCNVTFCNQTLVECLVSSIYPGRHSIVLFKRKIGLVCLGNNSFNFSLVPVVINFFPQNFSTNGGGLLMIEGSALTGKNTTSVLIGNNLCVLTTFSYVAIQCIVPFGNQTVALILEIDGLLYKAGEIHFSQEFTPVLLFALPSERFILIIMVSGITEVENMHIFIGDSLCLNVSGNSTALQCRIPLLPAGEYQVKGLDLSRGWATSTVIYTSHLTVTSLHNNFGCVGKGEVHIHGSGFSPGNTSVAICGTPCEIIDALTMPTDLRCLDWHLNDSLAFLCSFTKDTETSCNRRSNISIQCDVVVRVGTYEITSLASYTYLCDDLLCATLFENKKDLSFPAAFVTGLFFSPKVERDEVLIYNSSCNITMATEAEMECEAPNQPITAKITEIWKNWGQNTQNMSLGFCGLWSRNTSWFSGHPPQDGDNVTVERGQTLLLDTSTCILNLLHVKGGKLFFIEPGPVDLHAHYILISDGGELRIGSPLQPFHGKAQIHLYGSSYSAPFFPYGVKFLSVRNATLSIHGWLPQVSFTYLESEACFNDTRLVLNKAVDWRPGDEVIISGVDSEGIVRQEDLLTIESVNNTVIFIKTPLKFSYGFIEQWVEDQHHVLRPVVALLSRDIVVQGNHTTERMFHVQQCAEAGISDVSKCHYGKSERKLGSRDMGAVVIIQSFQSEPSLIQLEGVQFQHVGQSFRESLSALNIVGNAHMNDSYVHGCSVWDAFSRGLSLSKISDLRVENNVFYNILGHGLLVGEWLEQGMLIRYNALIGLSGTEGLSNIEALSPAGVYIQSPTNVIEDNTVCGAGYGYFFHLAPGGPSQAPVQSFNKNSANSCIRYGLWVYPAYQPQSTGTAVFQSFTAWGSQGGAQISQSTNLELRNFQIYSCRDFGIDITESLGNTSVANSLLIGHFAQQNGSCMVAGLRTPKRFQLSVSNTTFGNFDLSSCTAISTCSECYRGQGGFTVKTEQLKFLNSPIQISFPFPHSAIIEDLDGSLSGWERSHILAYMDTLPVSCWESANFSGAFRGSVCKKNVVFHRMSIGLKKAPEVVYNMMVTNSYGKTVTANYVLDTLSNLYGWMVLLVGQETYTLMFDMPFISRKLQYLATFDNFMPGNFLLLEHKNLPANTVATITCGGRQGQPLQSLPSPVTNKGCDWFFNSKLRKLTYLVTGDDQVQVAFKIEEGIPLPTAAPTSPPPVFFKWSLPETWEGIEQGWGGYNYSVPSAGDDIIILPNRTVLVDVFLPPLKGLYVLGVLEFPTNASNILSAACIVLAGGELKIGTLQYPLEREQKLEILLRASEGVSCDRLNGINVEPGTIGVYGKLQIHSAYPKKSWTHLRADIAPGNERIVLNDAVDWNPGENIVIGPSSYDAHEAELVTLKEINGYGIRIQERLQYRHIGSMYNIEDNRRIQLAAEVGLLTRNVQIRPDVGCSGRLLIGQMKNNSTTGFPGILQLSNVEILNFGSLQFSAVEFNNAPTGSSITFSSIHHSCGGGIQVVATNGIFLKDNVIFSTVGNGINVEGLNHTLVRNLVVLTKQMDTVQSWVAGINVRLTDDAFLLANAVAGSERIAFHIRGQKCFPMERQWADNVAHSSLHGVHVYHGDGFQNCTKISGFLSFKNYDYGVMFHVANSILIENITLIDNVVGLLPIVYELSGDQPHFQNYIELRNSDIVATSTAFDCLKDRIKPMSADPTSRDRSPRSPLKGRVGIIWPIFTSAPGQWPQTPWHRIMSYPSVSGLMKLQAVTFSSFVTSCYSDDNDVCIMSNPENMVMYPMTAEKTRMLNIKDRNKFYFHSQTSINEYGFKLCPEIECKSSRKALFKDLDGSTLGLSPPVSVFPKSETEWAQPCFNTGIYRKDSSCVYKPEFQGYFCQQIDHAAIVIENLEAESRSISPVTSMTESFFDVFSDMVSQNCICHSKPASRFYSILPAYKVSKLCFSGSTPHTLRLRLIGGQNTTKIILAIFYDIPQSLHVFIKGNYTPPTPFSSESLLMKTGHGTNSFQLTNSLLYVVLEGDDPIEIYTNISIHMAFTIVGMTGEDSQKQLIIQLADIVQIDQSQIRILQNVLGSDNSLKIITDFTSKRNLHCPPILSFNNFTADMQTILHTDMQETFQAKTKYKVRQLQNAIYPLSNVVIVEISDTPLSGPPISGTVLTPPLSYDRFNNLTNTIINDQQTGKLEQCLNLQIDSLVVIQPSLFSAADIVGNPSGSNIGSSLFVRPDTMYILIQPSDGEVDKPLPAQPKVMFLDKWGQRVENLGHPLRPWLMSVHLQGSSEAVLKGNTYANVQSGWANFSNLAVSNSGSDWYLIFNVTSPPDVVFTAQSKRFNIFPAPRREKSSTIFAAVLGSIASAFALGLGFYWFKKKNTNKTKIEKVHIKQRGRNKNIQKQRKSCPSLPYSGYPSCILEENENDLTRTKEDMKIRAESENTAVELNKFHEKALSPAIGTKKRKSWNDSPGQYKVKRKDRSLPKSDMNLWSQEKRCTIGCSHPQQAGVKDLDTCRKSQQWHGYKCENQEEENPLPEDLMNEEKMVKCQVICDRIGDLWNQAETISDMEPGIIFHALDCGTFQKHLQLNGGEEEMSKC
ncbi:fibrocystin isoform X2 [Rhinatrema bivittatum]|uniref:fibrocystin isoform X2 n=1 Tax=Rhinatrema bivittatum TaxID=194408 RepID=UPI00112CFF39|nr:fibrocystin isoform X2 [Rhinatrema bivittatum]